MKVISNFIKTHVDEIIIPVVGETCHLVTMFDDIISDEFGFKTSNIKIENVTNHKSNSNKIIIDYRDERGHKIHKTLTNGVCKWYCSGMPLAIYFTK